jgi:hypothetical protein
MTKETTFKVLLFGILGLLCAFPSWSRAGSVMIIKASALMSGTMDGLVTLADGLNVSRLEIDVASWGLNLTSQDVLVYDPAMGACTVYDEALIVNLPSPNEIITSADGKTGTLAQFLQEQSHVVYDTDLRMIGVMGLFPAGAPFPLPSASPPGPTDSTPPDTFITSGPAGVINQNLATFVFSGSDNQTAPANLVYAFFLDGYDAGWSGFAGTTAKTYPDLPSGTFIFWVKAKDEAQNVDPHPANRSFTVSLPGAGSHGDVNGDGTVDLTDALAALQLCAGLTPAPPAAIAADMNDDQKIDVSEAIYILQRVAQIR